MDILVYMDGSWKYDAPGIHIALDIFPNKAHLKINGDETEFDTHGEWRYDKTLLFFQGTPYYVKRASAKQLIFGKQKLTETAIETEWEYAFTRRGERPEF